MSNAAQNTATATATTAAPATKNSSTNAWLSLLLAGVFEIGYALAVGGSEGFTVLTWSLVAVVFFLLTLYALSLALRTIDVSIGYAVWAGIGAVGAAVLGPLFFDETLTVAKGVWLAVIIVGVIWLKLADRTKPAAEAVAPAQSAGRIADRADVVRV
ncbi:multidrug efflux SMR transporter [Streptomyces parvus]|uniref:DMT family transporter n=1 Tax=Streptomyces parvus TaxID=66428 RepID=UPI003423CD7D